MEFAYMRYQSWCDSKIFTLGVLEKSKLDHATSTTYNVHCTYKILGLYVTVEHI